jgi:hypothetical protein
VSFKEAHRQTCVKLGTLVASCAQVGAGSPSSEIPRRRNVVLWRPKTDPSDSGGGDDDDDANDSTAQAFLARYSDQLGWDLQPNESASPSKLSLVSSPLSWVIRRLSSGTSSAADADAEASAGSTFVRPGDMVLCESIVLECLQALSRRVRGDPKTEANTSRAWSLHGSDEFSLRSWLLSGDGASAAESEPNAGAGDDLINVNEFISSLPSNQLLWLLRLLERGKLIQVVTARRANRPDDAVVMPEQGASVEHCLAVLDLLRAKSRLERMVERAHQQQTDLEKQALEMHRAKRVAAAKTFLKRSKLCEQQAKQAGDTLLNVEHELTLLESSVAVPQVLNALKQANEVLKQQRVDLGEVDEVLEDMAENAEADRQLNDTLASAQRSSLLPVEALDEDALLEELRSLTLLDSSAPVTDPDAISGSESIPVVSSLPLPASGAQTRPESIAPGRVASKPASALRELVPS